MTSLERSPAARHWLTAAGLVGLTALGYANALDGPFVFDDVKNIVDNEAAHMTRLDWAALTSAVRDSPVPTRPLANISFALNHLLGGLDPRGFRLGNVAIHLLNGLLVYLLALRTCELARPPGGARDATGAWLAATAAAWIFVAHPAATQAVTYVVQRMTSLGATFFLLGLLGYVAARTASAGRVRAAYAAGAALAWICALGTKENTAILPLVIVLYESFFFRRLEGAWLRRAAALGALGLLLLAALGWAYLGESPIERLADIYARREFTLLERLLTETRVVVFYLSLLVWPSPSRMSLLHEVELSRSLLDPLATLGSVVVIVALLVLAFRHARRAPVVAFAVFWWFLNLVMESTVIPLELAYEHRIYLPAVGPVIAAGWLAARIPVPGAAMRLLPVAVLAAALALTTQIRNRAWGSDISLWSDVVQKEPRSTRGYFNLGNAHARRGEPAIALEYYARAVAVYRFNVEARNNAALLLKAAGRTDEARALLEEALAIDPAHSKSLNNLAALFVQEGRADDASRLYRRAIAADPDNARAHHNLANALARSGLAAEAEAAYREAIRLAPDLLEARNNLGILFAQSGRVDAAVVAFRAALAGGYEAARLNLVRVLATQGDIVGACALLEAAAGPADGADDAVGALRAACAALGRPASPS